MQWWGYLHTSGTVQLKRYHPQFGPDDMDDAFSSPFCARVVGPFNADSREQAEQIINAKLAA